MWIPYLIKCMRKKWRYVVTVTYFHLESCQIGLLLCPPVVFTVTYRNEHTTCIGFVFTLHKKHAMQTLDPG